MKPNREELERAIKGFENELRGMQNSAPRYMAQKRQDRRTERINTALTVLRAELSRQENAPLTCDGCKHAPRKWDSASDWTHPCICCLRGVKLIDRYEPKGEKE